MSGICLRLDEFDLGQNYQSSLAARRPLRW
jgi:hypothetical protein